MTKNTLPKIYAAEILPGSTVPGMGRNLFPAHQTTEEWDGEVIEVPTDAKVARVYGVHVDPRNPDDQPTYWLVKGPDGDNLEVITDRTSPEAQGEEATYRHLAEFVLNRLDTAAPDILLLH